MSSAACQTASMSAQVVFCGEVLKANRTEPTLVAVPEYGLRIETAHTAGKRRRAAVLLGRHRATISRETSRGATGSRIPRAGRAGRGRRAIAERPKSRKLEANPALLAEVLRRLEQRHSPEQIAGRLREDFPDDPEMWVSHETIYQAMYVQPRGELARQVKTALRTGRTRRKPQGRKETDGRGRLKGMVNISERPAEADDRAVPGHWEGDLIIGANGETAIASNWRPLRSFDDESASRW